MSRLSVVAVLGGLAVLSACREDGFAPTPPRPPEIAAQVEKDSGYILRNGMPIHVVFEIRNRRAIFEGDIDLGAAESIARTVEELRAAPQRAPTGVVTSDLGKRWPGGRVPYDFHPGPWPMLSDTQTVLNAMAEIRSRVGGVYFQRRTSWDGDHILFRPTNDTDICGQSQIGKSGGAQDVLIRENCSNLEGVIIHELGHALGFWHEQSRCDRDNYVEILWQNIDFFSNWSQFTKQCDGADDLETYDEGSIMHYRSNAYGRTGPDGFPLQTIRSLRGLEGLMGQLDSLSTIDVFTIDRMYQPFGPLIYSVTNQNGNPLLSWSQSGRAISYSISIVREYNEWDDYTGTHTSFTDYTDGVAQTPSLSALDSNHPWTGNSQCVLWSNINGSANYTYWYEIYATFANGVVSTVSRQAQAPIAPAEPPCPDFQ